MGTTMRYARVGVVVWMAALAVVARAQQDEGSFRFPETGLMRAAPRGVFVATMGDYRTPWQSGDGWGAWADAGEHGKRHEPDRFVGADGRRRDVASAFYPAVGPYDMSDPDLVEYH